MQRTEADCLRETRDQLQAYVELLNAIGDVVGVDGMHPFAGDILLDKIKEMQQDITYMSQNQDVTYRQAHRSRMLCSWSSRQT